MRQCMAFGMDKWMDTSVPSVISSRVFNPDLKGLKAIETFRWNHPNLAIWWVVFFSCVKYRFHCNIRARDLPCGFEEPAVPSSTSQAKGQGMCRFSHQHASFKIEVKTTSHAFFYRRPRLEQALQELHENTAHTLVVMQDHAGSICRSPPAIWRPLRRCVCGKSEVALEDQSWQKDVEGIKSYMKPHILTDLFSAKLRFPLRVQVVWYSAWGDPCLNMFHI